jgi:phage baseplate assembly protein W
MAHTSSIAFPNLFDVVRNHVAVLDDDASVVNRSRLLMLTEPTELYNEPKFGVGLRRYIWQYNNENTRALMKNRIVEQLELFEPSVYSDQTQFTDGLMFTGGNVDSTSIQNENQVKMTVALHTVYGDELLVEMNNDWYGAILRTDRTYTLDTNGAKNYE